MVAMGLAWLALAAMLAACATPYQPLGMSGGYSETKLTSTKYLVSFSGNEHTSRETVQAYLLNRCAELTLDNGFAYFRIVEGGVEGNARTFQTSSEYRSTTVHRGTRTLGTSTTYGTYTPGDTIRVTSYSGTVTIVMMNAPDKPDDPRLYDARELSQNLAPRIQR